MFKNFTAKVLAVLCIGAAPLMAETLTLSIDVAGTIMEAPTWKDSGLNDISNITFDFGSLITGQASSNVDSSARLLTLSDPSNTGGVLSVVLTTPSSCSIGSTSVLDSHVRVVYSSTEFGNAASIPLVEGSSNSFALRFADDGNYGDKAGTVSCGSAGSLTYTY